MILRKPGIIRPQIIAIGSSTGGPQALLALLKAIPASIDVPIVITQHMPPTFTRVLAEHIARACGRPCSEAVAGEALKHGRVYVAPGDHHLLLDPGPDGPVLVELELTEPSLFLGYGEGAADRFAAAIAAEAARR